MLSEEDKKLVVEGRILKVLSDYGGKRLVAGKDMTLMVKDLVTEIYNIQRDGLI